MADKYPLANGNWSNAANWNGGTKPIAGDDVYADGKTVTIDEDLTVASIRNSLRSGGTIGGGFVLSAAGLTITCTGVGVLCGYARTCIVCTATSLNLNSNCVGSGIYGNDYRALSIDGPGTIVIVGSVTLDAGTNYVNAQAVAINAAANVFVTGSVTGGNGDNGTKTGLKVAAIGALVQVIGSVTGGSGLYSYGIYIQTGECRITGSCTGARGIGVVNAGAGTVTINGNLVSAGISPALSNSGTAIVDGELVPSDAGPAYVGDGSAMLRLVGNIASSSAGYTGYGGGRLNIGEIPAVHRYRLVSGVEIALGSEYLSQPSASDVRLGVAYGVSSTGTCHVPAAASVLFGVPVDATVGTATIDAASIRAAVGLATANLDAQFAAIEVNPQSIRDAMKLAPSAGAAAEGSIDDAVIPGVNLISVAGTAQTAGDIIASIATIDPLDATETQAAAAAAIAAAGLAGTGGAYTQTVTVTSDGSTPIPNATVAIYSGSTLVDTKTTNSSGIATPTCDAGSYTLRVTASGYASHSAALTVTGDATVATITLSAISVTPSAAGFVTGYWTCYGTAGAIEAGTTHYLQVVEGAGTTGLSIDGTRRSAVSGVDGVVQFAGIPWGASVRVWRGTAKPMGPFVAPTSGTTWAMDEVVGTP